MVMFILAILCAILALTALALDKAYHTVPARELKRLARYGDAVASLLYKPVAYSPALRLLLWLIAGLAAAGSVLFFAAIVPAWLALLVTALFIWVGFAWLPQRPVSRSGWWLARAVAPGLAWLLERSQPLLGRTANWLYRPQPHTGLYDKEDLAELFERQKKLPDSRLEPADLDRLRQALYFAEDTAANIAVPLRQIELVGIDETVGPVLLDRLHRSGQRYFPVYEGKRSHLVGVLQLADILHITSSRPVGRLMRTPLYYVREDSRLPQVVQALVRTDQRLLLTINGDEEPVGTITLDGLLARLAGGLPADDFDRYDDPHAVATHIEQVTPVPEYIPESDTASTPGSDETQSE